MKKSCGECAEIKNVEYLKFQNEILKEENIKLHRDIKKYKYDSMTGLLGRADFNDNFDNLWYEHKKFGHNFALAIIDLNGLHNVNREHGFAVGDRFIIDTSDKIKTLFEDCNSYRTSGDEFFLLKRGGDCLTMKDRLDLVDNCEYCVVGTLQMDFESPTEMFNFCDANVIKKKELNKQDRE